MQQICSFYKQENKKKQYLALSPPSIEAAAVAAASSHLIQFIRVGAELLGYDCGERIMLLILVGLFSFISNGVLINVKCDILCIFEQYLIVSKRMEGGGEEEACGSASSDTNNNVKETQPGNKKVN